MSEEKPNYSQRILKNKLADLLENISQSEELPHGLKTYLPEFREGHCHAFAVLALLSEKFKNHLYSLEQTLRQLDPADKDTPILRCILNTVLHCVKKDLKSTLAVLTRPAEKKLEASKKQTIIDLGVCLKFLQCYPGIENRIYALLGLKKTCVFHPLSLTIEQSKKILSSAFQVQKYILISFNWHYVMACKCQEGFLLYDPNHEDCIQHTKTIKAFFSSFQICYNSFHPKKGMELNRCMIFILDAVCEGAKPDFFIHPNFSLSPHHHFSRYDRYGWMPLFYVIQHNDKKEVKQLLQKKANPNQQHKSLHSPLFFSIEKGFTKIVPTLLVSGADSYQKNDAGQTPLDFLISIYPQSRDKNKLLEILCCLINYRDIFDLSPKSKRKKSGYITPPSEYHQKIIEFYMQNQRNITQCPEDIRRKFFAAATDFEKTHFSHLSILTLRFFTNRQKCLGQETMPSQKVNPNIS